MYGSDGPGGDSGGPGGGSETVFGTDVRNRQCAEQCSEPTKLLGPESGVSCVHLLSNPRTVSTPREDSVDPMLTVSTHVDSVTEYGRTVPLRGLLEGLLCQTHGI